MSRSAKDATRFTATPPHAFSNPPPFRSPSAVTSTNSSVKSTSYGQSSPSHAPAIPPAHAPPTNRSPPPGRIQETPKEKVARLRAARLAQRGAQLSRWERTVIQGRVWADRVHRFTALSLIGFTVIATGVTTFALTDMILHNRRKRNAFYTEQHTIYANRLVAAIEMEKAGVPLDDDSLLILSRERAKVQAEERKKSMGIWTRVKRNLTGGLKKTMRDDEENIVVPSEAEILGKIGVSSVGVLEAVEGKAKINEVGQIEGVEHTDLAQRIEAKKRDVGLGANTASSESRKPVHKYRGGMLDRLGSQSAADADVSSRSRDLLDTGPDK